MKTRSKQAASTTKPGVVGIDISLKGPGICIVDGSPVKKVGNGLFADSALIRAGEDLRGPERLSVVASAVWSWLTTRGLGRPGDLYVTEGYAFSAQQAHSLGEMGGCIRRVIWESGGNLIIVPPPTLKKFMTGAGHGDKNIVIKHVFKRWGFDVDDDNQCDAFGCAVLGLTDLAGDTSWTAAERDTLTKKVQRYAGRGQTNFASTPPKKKTRKLRRQE